MMDTIIVLFRSGIVLVFGVAVSILFAGVQRSRKGNLAIIIFYTFILLIQILCWQALGLQTTMKLYPFITHLPSIMFIALYFKRPWSISFSSVLTAYLCCQIPKWIGSLSVAIFGNRYADHIAYLIAMCVVYYFLNKYVADSVIRLVERSTRSCLLFGAVPLLYYLFDYATTIYTNLLYTGAREAVQFAPSVICTFYLVFVLLYTNEFQKQSIAQRERDILISQLQQSQLELDIMRQMQNNTIIYRHDMRHHLSLIGGFAAEGDLQKIKDYLASTVADIDSLTPVRYCENETVNLILSSFVTRAKRYRVLLQTDVKLPRELGVNDTELCALLSNALENAIAAAAQLEDEKLRKVYFHAIINGDKLVISTENAYVGEIHIDGELPMSSKKEAGHGFGIKSIVAIVERYGGLYSFETEGGVFIMQIMIPLGKEKHGV
ncbi:sensor histidine kinase [Lachnospiraceae bacterium MD1]|uniref:Sensor histidine kinase n=1 Tax=Variimorphobacter saccharofermentans TaxID=2755051 RepID=A0A839K3E2_9FIRM|nr:ATP-binding protein [Variimorphobacter saccharofermentans]MBB2184136.1 sensor histidine kinase [Variimorphobacter saccharofermentans]